MMSINALCVQTRKAKHEKRNKKIGSHGVRRCASLRVRGALLRFARSLWPKSCLTEQNIALLGDYSSWVIGSIELGNSKFCVI